MSISSQDYIYQPTSDKLPATEANSRFSLTDRSHGVLAINFTATASILQQPSATCRGIHIFPLWPVVARWSPTGLYACVTEALHSFNLATEGILTAQVTAMTLYKMSFSFPALSFYEHIFSINNKNPFQHKSPLTSVYNRTPFRLMGKQPEKVNGEKKVANCFIQSPPLSASAVTNSALYVLCS